MRSWLAFVLLASIACCTMACSTKNIGLVPGETRAVSGSFTAVTEPGTGTFVPALSVAPDATGTTVTISVEGAESLAAAFVHLQYDASRYTPESVEFSSFLGATDEVLALALTDQPGEVPVGVVQIPSSGVSPRDGAGQLAVVHFRNTPFTANRSVSGAPSGTRNKVDDLAVVTQGNNQVTFQWTEKNNGDYNNNGTVGITDLTPLAVLFGQTVSTAADPIWAALVDGNDDGSINLADMTPIGQNFGDKCDGYILYVNAAATEKYDNSGIHAPRSAISPINPKVPVVYQFTANYTSGDDPEYSVRPVLGTDLNHPGPDSNHTGLLVDEPGVPEPPTNLDAEGGLSIGNYTIHLSWTPSVSGDVVKYELYRKLTSGSSWAKIDEFGSTITECSDFDETFTAESYDYRMLAKDFSGQTSAYSDIASATPYLPPTLDPPINAAAAPSAGHTQAIDVTWDKPANDFGTGFQVYCKGPGESTFSKVGGVVGFSEIPLMYTHTGLTQGQTYSYYITTLNGAAESAPSSTVSSIPSTDVLPVKIESITTDKTTHYGGGTEDAAQITVTCSPSVPDTALWEGPGVFSSTTAVNPTWKPNSSTKKGKVTLTVTVTLNGNTDSGTIDMYVTSEDIKTSFTDRGDGSQNPVGDPSGSGKMPNFDLSSLDYLEPLDAGGDITTYDGDFKEFTSGHVVLFNRWETW